MQIIRSAKAAERFLRRRYPSYEIVLANGRVKSVHVPVARGWIVPCNAPLTEGASLSEPVTFRELVVPMNWLDDGDGHVIWTGVSEVLSQVFYYCEEA